MEFLSYVFLLLLLFTTLCFTITTKNKKPKLKLPPGPTPLPIIGNLLQLGNKPHQSMATLAEIHGPIMTLKLGQITTIVISSPDMAKEVLQTHDQFLSNRAIPHAVEVHDHHKHSITFIPVSPQWRNLRKICNNELFSNKTLDASQNLRRQKLQELLSDINKSSIISEAVDIGKVAFKTVINLLSNTVFSVDLVDSVGSAGDFKELFVGVVKESGKPNIADYFPVLKRVDPQGIYGRLSVHAGRIIETFSSLVDQRLELREIQGFDKHSDMLNTLLNIAEDNNQEMNKTKIQHLCLPAKSETVTEKRSKVEIFKEQSNFIRYPLNEDVLNDAPNLSEPGTQLIKFHGSYQQYNRDERGSRTYSFMIRTKNPCGKVSNQLYLTMDDLADEFGIGTLRLTTRQTFQLHGVVKKELKHVMGTIIRNMGSSLGACGDLNRNVLAPAAPFVRKDYLFAQETAENIAALLTPQSGFYYDIWVDGERIMSAEPPEVVQARNDNSHGTNFPDSPEPIYGTQFLPRKFKIAVTVPTDNSVDILTNDIGVVVVTDDDGEPQGFNLYVGGGMGRTHRMETTFPRLAEPIGYVPKEDILYAVKAIVVTQRENGRRDDRRYSRLKYLLSSWGIEKFRSVVEQYYGKKFEPFRQLPEFEFKSYLGWHQQGDGGLFYGLHVDNGRIGGTMKKALREVIEKYNLNVRITPNQNIILTDIRSTWKRPITTVLAQAGLLQPKYVDPLNLTAMACPAFPLCPLAITEAERGIPDILKRIRAVFEKVGLKYNESVVVRITGCPNGCARPYMAELGLVGDGPNSYQIWLGGTPNQTSLAQSFMDKVKLHDLEKVFEPLFYHWKQKRQSRESFGSFTNRVGFEKLKDFVEKWEGHVVAPAPARHNLKLFTDKETYEAMDELAKLQNKNAHQLAMEVIRNYVASNQNGKSEFH